MRAERVATASIDAPVATVIIPTHNRRISLERTLRALRQQATARPWELIVVDDGSTPPVPARLLDGLPGGRLIRLDGCGPARARNAGLAAARGRYVFFTDDDTAPSPAWLEAACAFLDDRAECVAVEGPIVSPPYDRLYEISLSNSSPNAYWTANIAYRRTTLEALGGFSNDFPHPHCEDLDLGFRAEALGSIGFEESMQVTHFPRPITVGEFARRGRFIRSEVELFRRHRERYGTAAKAPAAVFAFSNAVRFWLSLAAQERKGLAHPRRLARFASMAAGHLATVTMHLLGAAPARAGGPENPDGRRPLKVLFVMPLAHRHGGAENILWTYLRRADRERIEPAVVFFDEGTFPEEVRRLGISTHIVRPDDCRRPRILLFPPRLARAVRREKPDLLLSWLVEAQAFTSIAALLTGRGRRVTWWQANMPRGGGGERLATVLPTEAVFLYSHETAAAQRAIWPHRRTEVVHPGIDPPTRLAPADELRLRQELSLPSDRPVIGIVGRLMSWKGQHHFLRALALLRDRGRPVHGLVVGGNAYDFEPDYEPWLHRLAGELGIDDSVTFTGQVPDGTPYLQLMDVSINASDPEPFGIVVLEAMALEVPVVAVNSGGPAEIIQNEISGLLVPSAQPVHFADAVERVAWDDDLRRRLVHAGRRRYEDRFTTSRMVHDLTAALERVHDRRPGRRQRPRA